MRRMRRAAGGRGCRGGGGGGGQGGVRGDGGGLFGVQRHLAAESRVAGTALVLDGWKDEDYSN